MDSRCGRHADGLWRLRTSGAAGQSEKHGQPAYRRRGIGGVSIVTPDSHDAPAVRHITHLVLSESRVWTSSEGQTLQAKLPVRTRTSFQG